jgi:hypothetical protein
MFDQIRFLDKYEISLKLKTRVNIHNIIYHPTLNQTS